MYHPTSYGFQAVLEFQEQTDDEMRQLIDRLRRSFPTEPAEPAEPLPRGVLFRHQKSYTEAGQDITVDITLWKDKYRIRTSTGKCEERNGERPPFESAIEYLSKALKFGSIFNLTDCSFFLFVATDLSEGGTAITGNDLFSLNVRPFGSAYETGLLFRWTPEDNTELHGPVVAQLLPMNKDASHLHCTFTYSIDEEPLKEPTVQGNILIEGLEFFSRCVQAAPKLAEDVFGR